MIRFTKASDVSFYAYAGEEWLNIGKVGFGGGGNGLSRHSAETDITEQDFLAFVRQHHDADTAAFVEKWIEKRKPKDEEFTLGTLPIRICADGHVLFLRGIPDQLSFDGQRKLLARLTENLRRHGQEA